MKAILLFSALFVFNAGADCGGGGGGGNPPPPPPADFAMPAPDLACSCPARTCADANTTRMYQCVSGVCEEHDNTCPSGCNMATGTCNGSGS